MCCTLRCVMATMSSTTPKAHGAIATPGQRQPLILIDVSTPAPENNEIQLRVQWNASSPLNLHQADSDPLIQAYPHILGDSSASIVTRIGPGAKYFSVGNKVFDFTFRNQNECAHQEFMTAPENLFGSSDLARECGKTSSRCRTTLFRRRRARITMRY
jgi:NADPH:quinone reductase-like Zn-dependent oxidoreductase